MTFNLDAIDEHFPLENYRDGQKEAIEFILQSYNDGKKIVILEAPTGSGKSIIAATVADFMKNSYYITITKQLQDQLIKDFVDIVELKGRNAYPCTFYQRYGDELVNKKALSQTKLNQYLSEKVDCTAGYCKSRVGKGSACTKCFLTASAANTARLNIRESGELDILPFDMKYSACPYYDQVYRAVNARKVIMNFSSFLYQTTMTKRFPIPRDLLILDECHNVESQLLDFISLTINDSHLSQHGIFIPKLENAHAYALWFDEVKIEQILLEAKRVASDNDNIKLEDELDRLYSKVQMFMKHITTSDFEWVSEYNKGKVRSVTLKPVHVTGFVKTLLFNHTHRVLMMSATILDIGLVCRSLGIDRSEAAAYRMKNRFPVKNRPIYLKPVGKLTGGKDMMNQWMPALIKGVDDIVNKYPDDKGIIHTHNFAIMDGLMGGCKTASRFVCQKNFQDKTKLLEYHSKQENSVIIAPAMHEGVDLIGELSRFQIVCKTPFPNFYENKQLARRMELDNSYYSWITALKLIQCIGRSVRSETDYADTYILDETIYRFLRDTRKILPSWFISALFDESGNQYAIK